MTLHILTERLHGFFENYASDEGLPPEHWFWDRSKSGGIFIEHGVHFFDLFAGWLGAGEVKSAQVSFRPERGVEEQVQCAVRYGSGPVINFYHGFTQAGRMDRQLKVRGYTDELYEQALSSGRPPLR